MKTEKVVLSFIAVVVGLLVAGVIFFIYQSTKTIPPNKLPTISITNPSPTPGQAVLLSIDSPADESVVTTRSLTITGKTAQGATLVLNTPVDDQVVTPTTTGSFSITTTLQDGVNKIVLTAIANNGQETQKTFTITSSTEDF